MALFSNRKSYLQPTIYSLLVITGIIVGFFLKPATKSRIYQILDIVQNDYVDQPYPQELEEDAIKGMLSQLDPHTTFVPAALVEYTERKVKGNYQGIGVDYIIYQDTAVIVKVYTRGPAYIAGLSEGDRIIEADGQKLTGDNAKDNKIIEAISGEPNSIVKITIFRKRNKKIIETQIRRGSVPLKSVETYYLIDKYTGIIKIKSFSANTYNEFKDALNALQKAGMTNLVIDLRNNGGGLLREAIKIANEFLDKGDLITYTQGRKRNKEVYKASGTGSFKKGRLLVITNRSTASASEILTGALQDNDRAFVIGSRTFGKGLVQEPYRLPDGSSLRLTVARYYTPSGRSIQKPYTKDVEAYRQEIYRRNEQIDLDTSEKKYFSTKLSRPLGAGGGISPDFTLTDTLNESEKFEIYLPGLFNSGILDIYILDHLRNEVFNVNNKYHSALQFARSYEISPSIWHNLKRYLESKPKYKNLRITPVGENLIKKYIKASIARLCFGEEGYQQVINQEEGITSRIQLAIMAYDKEFQKLTNK